MTANPYVSSEELYHFVGSRSPDDDAANWKVLSSILSSKCVSHPPHEVGWGMTQYTIDFSKKLEEGELISPTITCYCDIPFKSLSIHCTKYGKFGISFRRELLARYGARPVTYIPLEPDHRGSPWGATLLRDIQCVFHALRNHVTIDPVLANIPGTRNIGAPPKSPSHAIKAASSIMNKDILAFLKPFDTSLADDDPKNYYMEREWRKFGNLVFEAHDVVRVVVARGYGNRARAAFHTLAEVVHEI
jgi:abortive phage resistance protein AbiGi (putative antitoxin)